MLCSFDLILLRFRYFWFLSRLRIIRWHSVVCVCASIVSAPLFQVPTAQWLLPAKLDGHAAQAATWLTVPNCKWYFTKIYTIFRQNTLFVWILQNAPTELMIVRAASCECSCARLCIDRTDLTEWNRLRNNNITCGVCVFVCDSHYGKKGKHTRTQNIMLKIRTPMAEQMADGESRWLLLPKPISCTPFTKHDNSTAAPMCNRYTSNSIQFYNYKTLL